MKKKYKFAMIAIDVVIFTIKDNKLQVLLIEMKKKPYRHHWAAPGGIIKVDESTDAAAKRHLFQKTGVKNVYPVRNNFSNGARASVISNEVYLEQLYTFGKVDRDPFGRVVSVAYFALIPSKEIQLKTTGEYADVRWFPARKLPKMAYDHKEMIGLAAKRLRAKLGYTNIVYNLFPKKFTLSQLQKIYEVILGKKLDKRNFRKKIISLGLVKKTKSKQSEVANRPASLYKFTSRKPKIINIL